MERILKKDTFVWLKIASIFLLRLQVKLKNRNWRIRSSKTITFFISKRAKYFSETYNKNLSILRNLAELLLKFNFVLRILLPNKIASTIAKRGLFEFSPTFMYL